jgi:Protein of unknown function (DUF2997)
MAEIEFTIDPATGRLEMLIKGVAGPACDDVAGLVRRLLGRPAQDRPTPEYTLRPRARTEVRQYRA